MPQNLGVDTCPDPVGHFGAHWRPFWILQAVRRCRRWASAPGATRLVFFLFFVYVLKCFKRIIFKFWALVYYIFNYFVCGGVFLKNSWCLLLNIVWIISVGIGMIWKFLVAIFLFTSFLKWFNEIIFKFWTFLSWIFTTMLSCREFWHKRAAFQSVGIREVHWQWR